MNTESRVWRASKPLSMTRHGFASSGSAKPSRPIVTRCLRLGRFWTTSLGGSAAADIARTGYSQSPHRGHLRSTESGPSSRSGRHLAPGRCRRSITGPDGRCLAAQEPAGVCSALAEIRQWLRGRIGRKLNAHDGVRSSFTIRSTRFISA